MGIDGSFGSLPKIEITLIAPPEADGLENEYSSLQFNNDML